MTLIWPHVGRAAAVAGLAAAAYLGWCYHRVSAWAMVHDRAWPRPWPYPDSWLLAWLNRLSDEYPTPPGVYECEGDLYRLRGRLIAYLGAALLTAAAGGILAFRTRGRPPRPPAA